MNAGEIAEIRKTWEVPRANLTDSGAAILVNYVTKYPHNLPHFPFKDVPIAELSSNERFRSHVTKIMTVFDDSIKVLDNDAKVTEIWENLAKTHVKRKIEQKSYLELKNSILEVLGDACKLNDSQKAAWSKLIDHVYSVLFKKLTELGA